MITFNEFMLLVQNMNILAIWCLWVAAVWIPAMVVYLTIAVINMQLNERSIDRSFKRAMHMLEEMDL